MMIIIPIKTICQKTPSRFSWWMRVLLLPHKLSFVFLLFPFAASTNWQRRACSTTGKRKTYPLRIPVMPTLISVSVSFETATWWPPTVSVVRATCWHLSPSFASAPPSTFSTKRVSPLHHSLIHNRTTPIIHKFIYSSNMEQKLY